jgi:hypothetical protein
LEEHRKFHAEFGTKVTRAHFEAFADKYYHNVDNLWNRELKNIMCTEESLSNVPSPDQAFETRRSQREYQFSRLEKKAADCDHGE